MAEDLIKDIVSPDAIKQLDDLYTALRKNEEAMAEIVKKGANISIGGNMKELKVMTESLNKAMGDLNTQRRQSVTIEEKIAAINAKLANSTKAEALAYEEARQRLIERNRELSRQAKENINAEESLRRLQAQLARLNNEYAKMSGADREGIIGQRKLAEIQQLEKVVSQTEQSMGIFNRQVGNYKKGWDGIGNSVSQLTRELPAFTQSAQLGFLAISNNIPILVDEMQRLKVANAELNAQGVKTEPVWKTVAKSFMSWNTLLMVGVALLTAYGKDIVNWISGMVSGAKAQDAFTKELVKQRQAFDDLNSARLDGAKSAQDEITKLKLLYTASQNTTIGIEERTKAVDELQKMFPSYFGQLTNEQILTGKASSAYKELTRDILASAYARAASDKIVKNQERILDIEEAIKKANKEKTSAEQEYNAAREESVKLSKEAASGEFNMSREVVSASFKENSRKKAVEESTEKVSKLGQELRILQVRNEELAKSIKVSDLLFSPKDDKKGGNGTDDDKQRAEDRKKFAKEVSQSRIDAIKVENDNILVEVDNRYKKEGEQLKEKIKNEIKEMEDLAAKDKSLIDGLVEYKINKEQELTNGLEKLDKDRQKEREKLLIEGVIANAEAEKAAREPYEEEYYTNTLILLDAKKEQELQKAEETGADKAAIEEKYERMSLEAYEKYQDARVKKGLESIAEYEMESQKAQAAEQLNLAKLYAKGEITYEQYQKRLSDINYQYEKERLQATIDTLKQIVEKFDMSAEQKKAILKSLSDAEAELDNETTNNKVKNIDFEKERRKNALLKGLELSKDAANMIASFVQQEAEMKIAKIDEEIEKIDERREKAIEEVENGVMSEETKAQKIKEINEQADADKKKLEEEKKKEQVKIAIAQ